jgi:tripartite-type tricarboxylate transporter receptor subunit TctC
LRLSKRKDRGRNRDTNRDPLARREVRVKNRFRIALALMVGQFVLLHGAWAPNASAQSWPSKPITWIVPFGAGGGADIVSRIIGGGLAEQLKASIVIENKPGASSTIGTRAIATAEPDGYTVGLFTDVHPVNVATGQAIPYEPFRDFDFISQLITVPMILYGSPQRSLNTLRDVIAYAKENPGKLTAASIGPATPHHLTMQWLESVAGVRVTIVPYRSIPQGLQALVTGEADLMFVGAGGEDLVASGKIVALGMAMRQRNERAPNVPTLIEQGYPNFEMLSWYGLVAPKRTPQQALAKLHQGLESLTSNDTVKQRLQSAGATLTITKPDEFERLVRDSTDKFQKIAEAAKVQTKQ